MRLSWLLSNAVELCWSNNLIDPKDCVKGTCASYFAVLPDGAKKEDFFCLKRQIDTAGGIANFLSFCITD